MKLTIRVDDITCDKIKEIINNHSIKTLIVFDTDEIVFSKIVLDIISKNRKDVELFYDYSCGQPFYNSYEGDIIKEWKYMEKDLLLHIRKVKDFYHEDYELPEFVEEWLRDQPSTKTKYKSLYFQLLAKYTREVWYCDIDLINTNSSLCSDMFREYDYISDMIILESHFIYYWDEICDYYKTFSKEIVKEDKVTLYVTIMCLSEASVFFENILELVSDLRIMYKYDDRSDEFDEEVESEEYREYIRKDVE